MRIDLSTIRAKRKRSQSEPAIWRISVWRAPRYSPRPYHLRSMLVLRSVGGDQPPGVRLGTSATPLPRPPPKRESHLHGSHTYSEHLHVRPDGGGAWSPHGQTARRPLANGPSKPSAPVGNAPLHASTLAHSIVRSKYYVYT